MKDCDHKVAYVESEYDSGSWLSSASSVDRRWGSVGDGERFSFCPECGAPLSGFWQGVDASRKAHQDEEDRQEELAAAERARDALYSRTPPT